MNQIVAVITLIIYVILGGIPSIAMILGLPYVIGQKIFRKIKYGTKLTD